MCHTVQRVFHALCPAIIDTFSSKRKIRGSFMDSQSCSIVFLNYLLPEAASSSWMAMSSSIFMDVGIADWPGFIHADLGVLRHG